MVGASDDILTDVGNRDRGQQVLHCVAHLCTYSAYRCCFMTLAVGEMWLHAPQDPFVPISHSNAAGDAIGL